MKHFKRSEEEQQLIKGVQKKSKEERESSSDSEADASVGDEHHDDSDEYRSQTWLRGDGIAFLAVYWRFYSVSYLTPPLSTKFRYRAGS